jgi:hypothetical protein
MRDEGSGIRDQGSGIRDENISFSKYSRKPPAANKRPTTADDGRRWPTMADDGRRWPTVISLAKYSFPHNQGGSKRCKTLHPHQGGGRFFRPARPPAPGFERHIT